MADEQEQVEPTPVAAPPPIGASAPIAPETQAEQQAKQEASLSKEELAHLAEEHQAELDRQAEAEAKINALTLESLHARVEALEEAVGIKPPVPSSAPPQQEAPSLSFLFDVGDEVRTNEAVPRTGVVREETSDGRYRVCFDAENTNCALFTNDQLTLVKEEPAR